MIFSQRFLRQLNTFMRAGYVIHDMISDFLVRYLKQVKLGILVVAHISLLGLFFPQLARSFGTLAQNILLVILLTSPLSKLFRMKFLFQLMSLRRELGIWFAYAAIVHSLGYILDPDWFTLFITPSMSDPLSILPRYIFGILALILTLPLLITSNNVSLRLLKGNWKKVHWLAYPLFAFMLLHIFLPKRVGSGLEIFGWIQFILAFSGYIVLKILAKNNFLTPLREANEYVGRKYKEYQSEKM